MRGKIHAKATLPRQKLSARKRARKRVKEVLRVVDEECLVQQAAPPDEYDDEFEFIRALPCVEDLPPLPAGFLCLPEKARKSPRISLVLDLDETLVHTSLDDDGLSCVRYDHVFDVADGAARVVRVHVLKRPHVDDFLARAAELFEITVFTASEKSYADKLLSLLDPEGRIFQHRVFRCSCTQYEGSFVKDLRVLGRDLARTAIVDNSLEAFGLQLDNGIPIKSWFDDPDDIELLRLLPFLESLADADDVRPLIRDQFQLSELVHGAPSTRPRRHA